jgi:archaellum component FlaC
MTDKPYENREIDEKFNFIKDKLELILELIHEQASKTSEKVSQVEEDIKELREWKANFIGKMTIVLLVGGAIWTWISKKLLG